MKNVVTIYHYVDYFCCFLIEEYMLSPMSLWHLYPNTSLASLQEFPTPDTMS